jgi:hypothetical protein
MMSSLQGENLFYPIPAVDLQKKTVEADKSIGEHVTERITGKCVISENSMAHSHCSWFGKVLKVKVTVLNTISSRPGIGWRLWVT